MATAGATPLLLGLPDEIVIWEILVRLNPKSILRCRAVCRAWRHATSTRSFLLAHHGRQPNLPIICVGRNFLAFDHRAACDHLHTVAQLDASFDLEASCDGLLVLSKRSTTDTCFFVCNPATHEHALLGRARDLDIMGMYPHRPTGEYRLLLHRRTQRRWMAADLLPEGEIGCYIFTLGSDQPPRYIGWPEIYPSYFNPLVLVRDNLHWDPSLFQDEGKPIVFDTQAEMFREMRAPITPSNSYIFETHGTLGIYNRVKRDGKTEIVDIWVLQDYECEVWDFKYRIELPVAEIRGRFEGSDSFWFMNLVSVEGDMLLLVSFGQWLLHIDSDGRLVESFHRDGEGRHSLTGFLLKQTLVPHTFFTALEGYAVNGSPFI
uniref:Uncharacterized protein n=1 Tax=Avena sativa TaxID=4498 RepID=A0ACD5XGJ2_AVESA